MQQPQQRRRRPQTEARLSMKPVTVELAVDEDEGGLRVAEAEECMAADFRVLRNVTDDLDFMLYYDLYEREEESAEKQEDDTEAELLFDMGPHDIEDYLAGALVFESKNNEVDGLGAMDLELSFQTLSEVPVERFLAPIEPRQAEKPFLKPCELTPICVTQGNYSAALRQDMEAISQKPQGSRGGYLLKNVEDFYWIKKRYRYSEKVPFTKEERDFVPYERPEVKKQILLDPKIHGTMEKLSECLKRLKEPGVSSKDFLNNLETMQTLFNSSYSKILNLNSEVRFVNKQIASKNQNLEASIKTINDEQREAEEAHKKFTEDKELLARLRRTEAGGIDALMHEGETAKLRLDMQALAQTNEKEAKQKQNQELYKILIAMQNSADELSNKTRRASFAKNNKKELLAVFFGKTSKEKGPKEAKKRDYVETLENNEREIRVKDVEFVSELAESQKANVLAYQQAMELDRILVPCHRMSPRFVNSLQHQQSVKYVKDVAALFLEEGHLTEPNQEYLKEQEYPPMLRSQLLNTKQPSERDMKVQRECRPNDLVRVNTPVLERPLKTRYLRALN